MPLSGMEQTVVLSKVPVFFDVFLEVYMEIIQDSCGLIAHWVCSSLAESDALVGENYTIGFVEGGKLVGGLIFNNYRPNNGNETQIWTIDLRLESFSFFMQANSPALWLILSKSWNKKKKS